MQRMSSVPCEATNAGARPVLSSSSVRHFVPPEPFRYALRQACRLTWLPRVGAGRMSGFVRSLDLKGRSPISLLFVRPKRFRRQLLLCQVACRWSSDVVCTAYSTRPSLCSLGRRVSRTRAMAWYHAVSATTPPPAQALNQIAVARHPPRISTPLHLMTCSSRSWGAIRILPYSPGSPGRES